MGAGGVKNFSVGIYDGAPSTARSSCNLNFWLNLNANHCIFTIKAFNLEYFCDVNW